MRVMLIGSGKPWQVGAFFCRALDTQGHDYRFVDEQDYFGSLIHKIAYRLLGRPSTRWIFNRKIIAAAEQFTPHVVLVTKGACCSPQSLNQIKTNTGAFLINYATDDPFNPLNSNDDLVASIPLYDLYACTKRAIMDDVQNAGCSDVMYVPFAYEPRLHFPEQPATRADQEQFSSDVVFAGNGDADRFPFMKALAQIDGLDLHLYGSYWDQEPALRPYRRGFVRGREYRLALSGTKIAPCLVRRANRDGHVMRTFEVPACGAFMLAERTEEHLELFEEDEEAVCFGSIEELVDKVRYYLSHEDERRRIAKAGHRRVVEGQHTYGNRLKRILQQFEDRRGM
jgi:spore maturation protein CgeB